MNASEVKEYIDSKIYPNVTRDITPSSLNSVLTKMLDYQVQEDEARIEEIEDIEESLDGCLKEDGLVVLTVEEIETLLNL